MNPKLANAQMNRFKPQRSQWTGNGSLRVTQITSDETAGFGLRMQGVYREQLGAHVDTHTHTRTRTHTHTLAFHVLWGLSMDMFFILHKLYCILYH